MTCPDSDLDDPTKRAIVEAVKSLTDMVIKPSEALFFLNEAEHWVKVAKKQLKNKESV